MLLSHLKPYTEHTYSSIVQKTSWDISPLPNLLNALANFSFLMAICVGLTFPFPKKQMCYHFQEKHINPVVKKHFEHY